VIFSRFPIFLAVVFAAASAFADPASPNPAPPNPGPDVVARLGATDITASELRNFIRTLDPAVRKQALDDPAVMARLIRAELARIAVLKEAEAQKWDKRPEVVQEIQRVRDEAVTASFLKSVSAPPPDYPSDAEIKAAYDLNRDALMAPRQYRLSQIFVAIPAGADAAAEAAAKQKADDLVRKARVKGADFDALAKAGSDGKAAEQGGDLGWAAESEIMPEIRSQVTGMMQGEISDPIRTKSGWHIIRMDDTRPAAPRPLAEVRDSLAAALRRNKAQANEQAYLAGLLAKAPIAVRPAELRKLFESAQ
jgi:parvulin-like peptidyl-prolyl isomerase